MKKDRDRHSRRHRARLVLPALAHASLPKTSRKSIVPGKSIGGLGLGGSQTAVKKAWGANPGCSNEQDICQYDTRDASLGEATAFLEAPFNGKHFKVYKVVIEAAYQSGVVTCKPPLAKFETSKKLHLCSKLGALKRAYPKLKKEGFSSYVLRGPGKRATIFGVTEDNNVFSISIVSKLSQKQLTGRGPAPGPEIEVDLGDIDG